METYNNCYTKHEDEALCELHEIRHILHDKLKNKLASEINEEAMKKFDAWKRECSNVV